MKKQFKNIKFPKNLFSRFLFLILFLLAWQIVYILRIFPELLFPSVVSIFEAFCDGIFTGTLLPSAMTTLNLVFQGWLMGIIIGFFGGGFSIINRTGRWIINNFVFIMNPIPGLAIFPLCILFFGFGRGAMLFVLVHSVLWGFLLNILAGVDSMPKIYKEIGLNLELGRLHTVKDVYLPACMPYIFPGLKTALARAWRSALGIELIAGVMVGNTGLGWLMTYQRGVINIPGLIASIIIIIIIGLVMDALFGLLEMVTVKKWGTME